MTLIEGCVGEAYEVVSTEIDLKILRRLEALGLIPGTKIELLNRKKNGTSIFKVRGTRLAVGKEIAAGIILKEASQDE